MNKYTIYDIDAIRLYIEKSKVLPGDEYPYEGYKVDYYTAREEMVRTTMSDGVTMEEIKQWFENEHFPELARKESEEIEYIKKQYDGFVLLRWEYLNHDKDSSYEYITCERLVKKDIDYIGYAREESVDYPQSKWSFQKGVPINEIRNIDVKPTSEYIHKKAEMIKERYKNKREKIEQILSKTSV